LATIGQTSASRKNEKRFWLELAPREKSAVLRGPRRVGVSSLGIRSLWSTADAGATLLREARNIY